MGSYQEVMGTGLAAEVEGQLLEDLRYYGVSGEGLVIDWSQACGEGHCTDILGGNLQDVSGLAVLDESQNVIAVGWMDFIHGGGDNPLFVFWLFLHIQIEGNLHSVKDSPTIPEHIWERLPEKSRQLCAKEDTYDARWAKDPLVRAWRQERRVELADKALRMTAMNDAERLEKQREQEQLHANNEFVYLGNGPEATGPRLGWEMSPCLYLKCVLCGYLMVLVPTTYDVCFCGALHKDKDAGRVGSKLCDDAIEVYRKKPCRSFKNYLRSMFGQKFD